MVDQGDIHAAVKVLSKGGIIAYPTEAVFGLGCDPCNDAALQKLITLKSRDDKKGMIVIAARLEQLSPFLVAIDSDIQSKVSNRNTPPITWIVDAPVSLSPLLTGGRDSIAVRITEHPVAAQLCDAFNGAITSTSANISSHEPARTAQEVSKQFSDGVDIIVDAPVGTLAQPTRIIDARTNEVLR